MGLGTRAIHGDVRLTGGDRSVQVAQATELTVTGPVSELSAHSIDHLSLQLGDRSVPVVGRRGRRAEIPRPPSLFVGRERLLRALDEGLRRGGPPVVVTGPPGAGKTAAVTTWLARSARTLTTAWWVPSSHPQLTEGYLDALGDHLGVPHGAMEDERAAVTSTLLRERGTWAVVFDGCTDVDTVREHVPRAGGGLSVVTMREAPQSLPENWTVIDLPPLATEEARALLTGHAALEPDTAAALIDVIGRWPADVVQAARHLAVTRTDPGVLAAQLRSRAADSGSTAMVSLDLVASRHPLAWRVLAALSVLDHDAPVPREVLVAVLPDADPVVLDSSLAILSDLGMVDLDRETVRSLPAVDLLAEQRLADDTRRSAAAAVRDVLVDMLDADPYDPASWGVTDQLTPHVTELLDHHPVVPTSLDGLSQDQRSWLWLRIRAAVAAWGQGQHEESVDLLEGWPELGLAATGRDDLAAELLDVAGVAAGTVGNEADAARWLGAAVDRARALEVRLRTLSHHLMALSDLGDADAAVAVAAALRRQVDAAQDAAPGPLLLALRTLGTHHLGLGVPATAREDLLAATRLPVNSAHLGLVGARIRLAAASRMRGLPDEARRQVDLARMGLLPEIPDDHPLRRHLLLEEAAVLVACDDAPAAIDLLTRKLDAERGRASPDRAFEIALLWNRAAVHITHARLDEAEADIQAARVLIGPQTAWHRRREPLFVQVQAGVTAARGDTRTALVMLERALEMAAERDLDNAARLPLIRFRAQLLVQSGQADQAVSSLVAAEEALPRNSPIRPALLVDRGIALGVGGQPGAAIPVLEQAIRLHLDVHGSSDALAMPRAALARALMAARRPADAVRVAQEAYADLVVTGGDQGAAAFEPLLVLAAAQGMVGDLQNAATSAARAHALVDRFTRAETPVRANCLVQVAYAAVVANPQLAIACLEEARRILSDTVGAHHPFTRQVAAQIGQVRLRSGLGKATGFLQRLFNS